MDYEFHESGNWYHVMTSSGDPIFCKIDDDQYEAALKGMYFKVYHPCVPQPGGLRHLPSATKTGDPWFLNGAQIVGIALVQGEDAEKINAQVKSKMSAIIQPGPKQIIHAP